MSDDQRIPLELAWQAFGHRLATVVGACAGLIALLAGASVGVACLRGGLAWAASLATARAARWLLVRVAPPEPVPVAAEEGVEEDSTLKASEAVGR